MVPYVDTVVAVTMMRVLLYEGARVMVMRMWGWMRCGCGRCRACVWHTWFMYCV